MWIGTLALAGIGMPFRWARHRFAGFYSKDASSKRLRRAHDGRA